MTLLTLSLAVGSFLVFGTTSLKVFSMAIEIRSHEIQARKDSFHTSLAGKLLDEQEKWSRDFPFLVLPYRMVGWLFWTPWWAGNAPGVSGKFRSLRLWFALHLFFGTGFMAFMLFLINRHVD